MAAAGAAASGERAVVRGVAVPAGGRRCSGVRGPRRGRALVRRRTHGRHEAGSKKESWRYCCPGAHTIRDSRAALDREAGVSSSCHPNFTEPKAPDEYPAMCPLRVCRAIKFSLVRARIYAAALDVARLNSCRSHYHSLSCSWAR